MTTVISMDSCAPTERDDSLPTSPDAAVRLLPERHINDRLRHLKDACALLADGFDGLDRYIATFVAATTGTLDDQTDVDAFLDWLEQRTEPDDEQRDFIAALSGRRAVEFVAVRQRLAHARFQELTSMTRRLLGELETNPRLTIHMNPIHVWSQFETRALLDDNADVPATVLFVPVGGDVRAVVIEPAAERLLRDIESGGPTTSPDLLRRTPRSQRRQVLETIRTLARLGVIAFG